MLCGEMLVYNNDKINSFDIFRHKLRLSLRLVYTFYTFYTFLVQECGILSILLVTALITHTLFYQVMCDQYVCRKCMFSLCDQYACEFFDFRGPPPP